MLFFSNFNTHGGGFFFCGGWNFSKSVNVTSRLLERWEYAHNKKKKTMGAVSLLPTFPPSWNVSYGPTPHFIAIPRERILSHYCVIIIIHSDIEKINRYHRLKLYLNYFFEFLNLAIQNTGHSLFSDTFVIWKNCTVWLARFK